MALTLESPILVDCQYLMPRYAAAYLLVEQGRVAFIENNTQAAWPYLLRALKSVGLGPEAVDYAIITHVHLDHAGGTSQLVKNCPNATVLAHPRAARHVRDPSRLIAGARAVYGQERFDELYGQIEPVDGSRVCEMNDGQTLRWGEREWTFLHTRGHANHHFCIVDSKVQGVFTGDAFGIGYPDLQTDSLFVFPSTSPTDYDGVQALRTLEQIAELPFDRAFLTHFGEFRDLRAIARQLREWIEFSEELVDSLRGLPQTQALNEAQRKIDARFQAELRKRQIDPSTVWERLALDRQLNAAGLVWAVGKAITPNTKAPTASRLD